VLRDVQTLDLLFFGDADAGDPIGDLEQYDRADDGKTPCDQDTDELIAHLAPMAVQSTDWFTRAEDRVDNLLREDAGQQGANGAAGTVDTDDRDAASAAAA